MAQKNLFEQLQKGLGDAVSDIRERVVEEGWYGRVVSDRESAEPLQWPQAKEPEQSFGSSTHTREMEPNRDAEQDIDR